MIRRWLQLPEPDAATIARFMAAVADLPTLRELPDADVIWLKGRLLRKWDAERRAHQPLVFADTLAIAASVAMTVLLFFSLTAGAAQGDGSAAAFDVASVKPNKSGEPSVRFRLQPGGRLTAQNAPVQSLITFAYAVQPFQLDGGPGWVRSDRFDITAKTDPEVPPTPPGTVGPIQLMMRSLLADRFKLKVHRETKDMPTYALVLARSDGRLGDQMTASTTDCAALIAARLQGATGPTPPAQPGARPQCRISTMGPGIVSGDDVAMAQFAQVLSQTMDRVVVDKTGLTALYSFRLEFTPAQLPPGGLPPGAPPIDPDGPSLFAALQEQLGLKLEAQRSPVEMLVIDSVEQPTPD